MNLQFLPLSSTAPKSIKDKYCSISIPSIKLADSLKILKIIPKWIEIELWRDFTFHTNRTATATFQKFSSRLNRSVVECEVAAKEDCSQRTHSRYEKKLKNSRETLHGNKGDFWLRGQNFRKCFYKPDYFQKSTKSTKQNPKISKQIYPLKNTKRLPYVFKILDSILFRCKKCVAFTYHSLKLCSCKRYAVSTYRTLYLFSCKWLVLQTCTSGVLFQIGTELLRNKRIFNHSPNCVFLLLKCDIIINNLCTY